MLLHLFISDNLDELTWRARSRASARLPPVLPMNQGARATDGVRILFAQVAALLAQHSAKRAEAGARDRLDDSSDERGRALLAEGLTIGQVVHGYGDVCQVVTELAIEKNVSISADDFRTFNGSLDEAIARAVTSYARLRERTVEGRGIERLGELAHELRNALGTAMLSFDAIQMGVVGTQGSVSAMHSRSLMDMRGLLDRAFTEVRLDAELLKQERVVVAELIEDAEIAARFQAAAHKLELFVSSVDPRLTVRADRQVLSGALTNLLQNAFKFTRPSTLVSLLVHATEARVLIDVQDQCGGLPAGKPEELFRPFQQGGAVRSGLGLGLQIARRAVEASGGELHVTDLPSLGCRFTIDLPRAADAIVKAPASR